MLVDAFPCLPVEEEGGLADPRRRDNFIERVFAYGRLRRLFTARWTYGGLVRFHAAHKLMLMAHSPDAYRRLGALVGGGRGMPRPELERRYTMDFMQALEQRATTGRHTNVLQHIAGYFKGRLDAASRQELGDAIDDYRRGAVPLATPLAFVRSHVRALGLPYLAGQYYLEPYPQELMLPRDLQRTDSNVPHG